MRFVVIGAGQTGANVAIELREAGFDGELLLLGDEPGLPFGRPPLSKSYMTGEEDLEGWLPKPGEWYEANAIELRPESGVARVDPAGGRVVLRDGTEITCDKVCVATGARPLRPDMPGVDLDGVFTLRTKADADAIRSAAQTAGAGAVVVGMGFIGSEVAASLRRLGASVTAVFPGSGPLASVLGDDIARRMGEIHRSKGVDLVADEKVAAFEGAGRVQRVVTTSGRKIDCTFAVVGLGVEPNVGILDGTGIATDDGVLVDERCRTDVEAVFAAGDVANHAHPLFGRIRVEHYNNAEKQGRHAARAMLGATEPYDYVHTFWSDFYEHKLEYAGFTSDWDDFVVAGDVEDGPFLGFYLKEGRLRAAMGLDRGGDPEAEPDSELAAFARVIREGKRVDKARLASADATGLLS